ncbi:MAG: HDOD domain-containing protein [Candidatus Firestonebacteria bacterium]|nr:HDOD domain-containing protein [Candidatus Firestonebacteria bacterium]
MKKQILFVDDEQNILNGLRHRLHYQREKWDMTFVESGREALAALERAHFDVIISDMRMPEMDGPALLQRVRETHPGVARIVLSGHADEEAMLRVMATAHQFLFKPCDFGLLESIISRVCNLQDVLNDEAVKDVIGKIRSLPSQPTVYSQLVTALEDEDSGHANIAHILKKDSVLCAQMLHVVNSAYFRLAHPIVTMEDAVVYLGLDTIRQLVLVTEIFRQAHVQPQLPEMPLADLAQHALLSGGIASALFPRGEQKEAAFVAALLHDIGKILLVSEMPDRVRAVMAEMKNSGEPMHVVEKKIFNTTHAEIGAYLLGMWQIPFTIVEAIANHHTPERVENTGHDLTLAVHIADALAGEQLPVPHRNPPLPPVEIDPAFLEKFGGAEKLPQWRELARTLAQKTLAL